MLGEEMRRREIILKTNVLCKKEERAWRKGPKSLFPPLLHHTRLIPAFHLPSASCLSCFSCREIFTLKSYSLNNNICFFRVMLLLLCNGELSVINSALDRRIINTECDASFFIYEHFLLTLS